MKAAEAECVEIVVEAADLQQIAVAAMTEAIQEARDETLNTLWDFGERLRLRGDMKGMTALELWDVIANEMGKS